MLLRFDPFREFDRMTEEFDRATGSGTHARSMPMDAVKRGGHVVATIDLPGVRREDLDVSVERNVLTVKAVRHPDVAEDDERLVGERRHGEFARQLLLGDTLDASRVEADLTDGVLTLRIPVAETAKPRSIDVGTGAGAGQAALSA